MIQHHENKVAVVTGGAGGIGMAMARRFLDEGIRVVIADAVMEAVRETDSTYFLTLETTEKSLTHATSEYERSVTMKSSMRLYR